MSELQTPLTVSFGEEPIAPHVESVSGLGVAEGWGRWNNDNCVIIRFDGDLPRSFDAHFACAVASANVGRVITVIAGGCVRRLVCTRNLSRGLEVVKIRFQALDRTRTLEVLIPDREPATVSDVRSLGFALGSLSVLLPGGSDNPAQSGAA